MAAVVTPRRQLLRGILTSNSARSFQESRAGAASLVLLVRKLQVLRLVPLSVQPADDHSGAVLLLDVRLSNRSSYVLPLVLVVGSSVEHGRRHSFSMRIGKRNP